MNSLVDLYLIASQEHPEQAAFFSGSPQFTHVLTWKEIWTLALAWADHLRKTGINKGERVAIMANSSWRWEVAQLATYLSGSVVVGIDPNENERNLKLIAEKSDIRILFYDQNYLLEKWTRAVGSSCQTLNMAELTIPTARPHQNLTTDLEVNGDSEAIIIFTSGTTSEPKGISYSHRKILLAVENIVRLYPEGTKDARTVCWLPLANLFQRMMNFCTVFSFGKIYFIENPVEVMANLATCQPTTFASVPRFYDKIYDTIQGRLNKTPLPLRLFLKSGLFLSRWHWKLKQTYTWLPERKTLLFPWELILFRKLRSIFGSRIQFLVSGSAPLRRNLSIFYFSIGLPILEAYGASENTVPIAANTLTQFRLGSVGKPVIENSVKLSSEGEVLIKGGGLFDGYLKDPRQDIFDNGYYRTGDLGRFDQDGFLYLYGRATAMFKTTTGKKVPIQEIESEFKKLLFIDQVVVIGEGRKLPVVILSLDLTQLASFQKVTISQLLDPEHGELAPYFQSLIENQIRQMWTDMNLFMKPAGALVLARRFSLDKQEITPNLKIRTKSIEASFAKEIDQLYLSIDNDSRFPCMLLNEKLRTPGQPEQQLTSSLDRHRLGTVLKILFKIVQVRLRYLWTSEETNSMAREMGQILRHGLGTLKGPLQKVGQMLSYLAQDLPVEFREELSILLREGTQISPHILKAIVEEELKKPLIAIFAEWSDTPLSSASVGQVHWARLTTGEPVAVKILVPGIESSLKADLRFMRWTLPIIKTLLKFKSIVPHFAELKELLELECDFRNEAKNLLIFRQLFKDDPEIYIPKVYKNLSTSRVLVMEYIEGQTFEEFKASSTPAEKLRAAKSIWTFASKSINLYAIFNADPHPGNFIFTKDRVAVVDFGFCKIWKGDFIRLWKKQVLLGLTDDTVGFEAASRAVGVINNHDPNYYKDLLANYHRIIFLPWLKDEEFHFTHEFVKEYLRVLFESQISVPGLELPREFLSLSRLYWGKFAIMAELDVTANFYQWTIPYVQEELRPLPSID